MITAIYSLSHIYGAEIWIAFWLICFFLYAAICLLIPYNRSKRGIKTVLLHAFIAAVSVDLIWMLVYYPGGSYINYGIGAVCGWSVWIVALVIAGVTAAQKNIRYRKQG